MGLNNSDFPDSPRIRTIGSPERPLLRSILHVPMRKEDDRLYFSRHLSFLRSIDLIVHFFLFFFYFILFFITSYLKLHDDLFLLILIEYDGCREGQRTPVILPMASERWSFKFLVQISSNTFIQFIKKLSPLLISLPLLIFINLTKRKRNKLTGY